MSIFTKILAGFGHARSMEKLHVDDHTEAIIKDIKHKPFGISENTVLYAGLNELGGYYFFQTVVVGQFHIKTIKGATLILKGQSHELSLTSDTLELESDFSNVSNRSITKIDFQIEKDDLEKIQSQNPTTIILATKKKRVEFVKYNNKAEKK